MKSALARLSVFVEGVFCLVAGNAFGQERLQRWIGNECPSLFGESISVSEDLSGDGISDVLASDPNENGEGVVRCLSGADGSTIWTLHGGTNEGLGVSVLAVGDVDGDGINDFFCSDRTSPGGPAYAGGVTLYSGATLSAEYSIAGVNKYEYLGFKLVSVGDVDGDGVRDLAIGYFSFARVRVISAKSGSVLYDVVPPWNSFTFGYSMASGADIDGDGVDDLIVGDPYAASGSVWPGASWVFSMKSGALLYANSGLHDSDLFGYSVSLSSDIDGDGTADYVVGAPGEVDSVEPMGHVYVCSGRDGSNIMNITAFEASPSDQSFGANVMMAGDTNGDGFGDFYIEDVIFSEFNASVVYLASGRDGGPIYYYEEPFVSTVGFGVQIESTSDVSGDGNRDVVISNPNENDLPVGTFMGVVTVWRGDDLFVLASPKCPRTGIDSVDITIGQGPANSLYALFLVDISGNPVSRLVSIGVFDSAGRGNVGQLQAPPGLQGVTFGLKAFALSGTRIVDTGVETIYVR